MARYTPTINDKAKQTYYNLNLFFLVRPRYHWDTEIL